MNINEYILDKIGEEVKDSFKEHINSNTNIATGEFHASIFYRTENGNKISIYGNDYGEYLDSGTKPHSAPIDKLQPWATLRGVDVWWIWGVIKNYGTKAQPFLTSFKPILNKIVTDNIATGMNYKLKTIFKK